MSIKWRLVNALSMTAGRLGILALAQHMQKKGGTAVAVLTYHRIANSSARTDLDPTLISATPEGFAAQLDYLASHFRFVSAAEVLAASQGNDRLPANALLLSFDDAYTDFATTAWPELRARKIPAVLFVPTGYATDPGRRFWWDDLHHWLGTIGNNDLDIPEISSRPLVANKRTTRKKIKAWLKSLPPAELESWLAEKLCTIQEPQSPGGTLDWDSLRNLANQGVDLCPHSVSHPIMTQLSDAEVRSEIEESYLQLARQTNSTLPIFAYPSGYTNAQVTSVCSGTSMALAFTTRFGIAQLARHNHWELNRINVSRFASADSIRSMILAARWRR